MMHCQSSPVSLGRALVAIIGALWLAACSQPHSLFVDEPAGAATATTQISVVQGDALVVDGRRVHLVDAVTPQPAPDASCAAEAAAARQARLRMTELAARVHHVDVQTTGTVDGYNRANAHVRFDGIDPAQVLINEGLAVSPQGQTFSWCGPLSDAQGRRLAMLSLTGS
jgi:endonuclease YncB( thermonuclease family)